MEKWLNYSYLCRQRHGIYRSKSMRNPDRDSRLIEVTLVYGGMF